MYYLLSRNRQTIALYVGIGVYTPVWHGYIYNVCIIVIRMGLSILLVTVANWTCSGILRFYKTAVLCDSLNCNDSFKVSPYSSAE